MEARSHLFGGTLLQISQPSDFAVRGWEPLDHLQQDPHHLACLLGVLGADSRRGRQVGPQPWFSAAVVALDRCFAARRRQLSQRLVTHDGAHPPARRRLAAVLPKAGQHRNPTLLQRILRARVIRRQAARDGHESRRAAPDPGLVVAVEEGAGDGVRERRQRRLCSSFRCRVHIGISTPKHPSIQDRTSDQDTRFGQIATASDRRGQEDRDRSEESVTDPLVGPSM